MQGSLLGSLYGNLPAPKSGPPPPQTAAQEGKYETDIHVLSGFSSHPTPPGASPAATSNSAEMLESGKTSTTLPRNLLLMAPPPRKRDAAQRRGRPGIAPQSLKRTKETGVGVSSVITRIATSSSVVVAATKTTTLQVEGDVAQQPMCSGVSAINAALVTLTNERTSDTVTTQDVAFACETSFCSVPRQLINEYGKVTQAAEKLCGGR